MKNERRRQGEETRQSDVTFASQRGDTVGLLMTGSAFERGLLDARESERERGSCIEDAKALSRERELNFVARGKEKKRRITGRAKGLARFPRKLPGEKF